MSIDFEAQFSISAVAEAAGCLRVTLDAWRNRKPHLFADTVTGTREKKSLSLIDACVARTVQLLTAEHGFSAQDAIPLADKDFRAEFILAFRDGLHVPRLVGLHKGSRDPSATLSFYQLADDQTLRSVISATRGLITIIDVIVIINEVMAALDIKAAKPND